MSQTNGVMVMGKNEANVTIRSLEETECWVGLL